jgi:NitT/TauT family transport system permease protein
MAIDPELMRLATVLRAKRSRVFMRMRLPQALPSIFSGIKVATSLGVIGAIIAEFVASDQGWGYLLVQASGTLDTPIMFAIVIVLAVVASVLFYIVGIAERVFVSWHASQRTR